MLLQRVINVQNQEFEAAMEIYAEAFPEFERMPIPLVKTKLGDQNYQLVIGKDNGEVRCFALLYFFKNPIYILLDYYAIHRNFRNQGIGFQLLRQLCDFLQINAGERYLLLEVEDPAFGENRPDRERRMAFYHRFGIVTLNGVRYYLPGFFGNDPIEMLLMIYPKPPLLTRKDVSDIIKELYITRYKRNPKEPILQKILDSIPKTIEFGG
jgi:GNAT superfamily N-acetyltransferase